MKPLRHTVVPPFVGKRSRHPRRGFTLIELLVVIAIIGILAAMLFPVFARARESARKIQCLSNIKNIAIAVNMYLADYNAFPPPGYGDATVANFFDTFAQSNGRVDAGPNATCIEEANPYVRVPVILDEYIKDRQVWLCPSAKYTREPGYIVPVGRGGYWLNNYIDHPNFYSDNMAVPCFVAWPTGWGGPITDSFVQEGGLGIVALGHTKDDAFGSSIGFIQGLQWLSQSQVQDPARLVVASDNGSNPYPYNIETIGWPDLMLCGIKGNNRDGYYNAHCCNGTGESTCCQVTDDQTTQWMTDANWRREHTRHMGGSNLGFADGHAKWMASEALLSGMPPFNKGTPIVENKITLDTSFVDYNFANPQAW
jgi:prepilin-type N-terminal cleavage/methylation domain-containing protein/prepilin-type processing-associated H-X9-DG protein